MTLIWRGSSDKRRAEREGRILEVSLHTDGTWRLLVWKDEARSAIAGIFASVEVACICAETVPLDDASLARLSKSPLSAFQQQLGSDKEPSRS